MLLINGEIYLIDRVIRNGYVKLEAGKIVAFGEMAFVPDDNDEVVDVQGAKVLPGFIDQHIHGADGADAMDASVEANRTIASYLPKEGTTSYLATTMTQAPAAINAAIDAVVSFMASDNSPGQAEVLGLHLEGPFISPHHIGAQNPAFIAKPEIATFDMYNERAKAQIRLVTYAPEEAEDGFTDHLTSLGVVASAGHTDASFDDIKQRLPEGLVNLTHFHNAMTPHHHRTPGVVTAGFFYDQLKAELICDGVHLDFDVVRTTYKIKGREGIILVTDAMRAKGLPDGVYDLGGQSVHKVGREARLESGVLAGSVAEMNDVVRNVKEQVTNDFSDLMYVAAINSAKQLGVFDRKGSIAIGKDADIVVLNENVDVLLTICRGVIGYDQLTA
jgi:N-acetylglucosamine-6-phosphate deacetylase